MNEFNQSKTDPMADFTRLWQDAATRILQAAGTFTPETMPPEMLRQIRSGIFQALTKSWEEFLRSPQFLEGMKQMMDNAIAFRSMSAEFLTRARQEMQGTSRQDVDDMLLAMREMEARLTRRVDALAAQVGKPGMRVSAKPKAAPRAAKGKKPVRKRTSSRKTSGKRQ